MAQQQQPDVKLPDPVEMSQAMARIAERSQKLVSEFLERQSGGAGSTHYDPLSVGQAFLDMTTQMMADPTRLMQAQMNLWQDYMRLWQSTTRRLMGGMAEPVAEPDPGDRRFKHEDWEEISSSISSSSRTS